MVRGLPGELLLTVYGELEKLEIFTSRQQIQNLFANTPKIAGAKYSFPWREVGSAREQVEQIVSFLLSFVLSGGDPSLPHFLRAVASVSNAPQLVGLADQVYQALTVEAPAKTVVAQTPAAAPVSPAPTASVSSPATVPAIDIAAVAQQLLRQGQQTQARKQLFMSRKTRRS